MFCRLLAMCHDCGHVHLIDVKPDALSCEIDRWLAKHEGHNVAFKDPGDDEEPWRSKIGAYRHNADIKIAYSASNALTITLASLATDANLLTGSEGTAVSNLTALLLDQFLSGKITTGTTPTTAKQIRVYTYAQLEDTPTYPDVFDGLDSAETVTSADIRDAALRVAQILKTDATSDRAYWFGPVSLSDLYGFIPKRWGPFVTHDTAVNLNATAGNQAIWEYGMTLTSV